MGADDDAWEALVGGSLGGAKDAKAMARAEARRPAEPRPKTDEELGIGAGPLYVNRFHTRNGQPIASEFSPEEQEGLNLDPTAQDVAASLLAGGVGRVAGPILGKVAAPLGRTVGPAAARLGTGAAEGATAAKVTGGNPLLGAAVGGGLAIPGAAATVARGAPARVAERTMKNITEEGVTGKVARQVEARAGEEGENLAAVLDNHPELRKALALKAKNNPAKALEAVAETKSKINGVLDPAFEQMDAHAATVPPSAQATVSQLMDEYDGLARKYRGDLDKTRAIRAAKQALIDEYGSEPGTVIPPSEPLPDGGVRVGCAYV